jgi:zinc/manganese transport system substrate-binding protein
MNKKLLAALFTLILGPGLAHSESRLKILTTTSDLASIAQAVGGAAVDVEALAKGFQNPHFVEPKPSLIVKLMKADAIIVTGLELEVGWAPLLIRRSANTRIQPGSPGYIDASEAVHALDVPSNPSRAEGDVHPGGNPHYMTDPLNGKKVAAYFSERFKKLAPQASALFDENLKIFIMEVDQKTAEWNKKMMPFKGTPYVSYHKNWTYFAQRFGLESVGEVEPKPGIPPTAGHTAALIAQMKARKTRLVLTDPWYESRNVEFIAKETNTKLILMAMFPGSEPSATDYLTTIDLNIRKIVEALNP